MPTGGGGKASRRRGEDRINAAIGRLEGPATRAGLLGGNLGAYGPSPGEVVGAGREASLGLLGGLGGLLSPGGNTATLRAECTGDHGPASGAESRELGSKPEAIGPAICRPGAFAGGSGGPSRPGHSSRGCEQSSGRGDQPPGKGGRTRPLESSGNPFRRVRSSAVALPGGRRSQSLPPATPDGVRDKRTAEST